MQKPFQLSDAMKLELHNMGEMIDGDSTATDDDTRPSPSDPRAHRRYAPEQDRALSPERRDDYPPLGVEVAQPSHDPANHPTDQPALLNTRQATHGLFRDNAMLSQALKRIFRAAMGWELLDDVEREAMDMIALKFSRVLSGRSLELQHWEDVEGYAHLVVKQCKPL